MLDNETLLSKMDASETGMERWTQSQSALMRGAVDIAQATQAFRQSRLHANIEASKTLMSCQHAGELAGLQRVYWETLSRQYRDYVKDLSVRIGQCVGDMTLNRRDEAEL